MPTRSPSTPASIRFLAWAAVTTGGGGGRQRNNLRIDVPNLPRGFLGSRSSPPTKVSKTHPAHCPPFQEQCHHLEVLKDSKEDRREDSTLTIPPNHLKVGVLLLDVVHHGDLIHRVPLGGIL
jgi:hypothetical protein